MKTFKTYDLAEVRSFTVGLYARITRCDNGEGDECANLEGALRRYAGVCCDFADGVRGWARAIFTGQIEFDPTVEKRWKEGGLDLFSRATEMYAYGATREVPCYTLEAQNALGSALRRLERLLRLWVTPKPAVGAGVRSRPVLSPQEAEEARAKIRSLPPLPADWQPVGRNQQRMFRLFKRQRPS